jgi:peroxiredoxin
MKLDSPRVWVIIGSLLGACASGSIAALCHKTLEDHRHGLAAQTDQLGLGSMAPDFALRSYDGNEHALFRYRGRKVIVNFFCGCRECQIMAREWQRQFDGVPGLQVLAIASFSPTTATEFRRHTGITFPLLFDSFGNVAQQYRSVICPRCWLVNEQGRVIYSSLGPPESLDDVARGLWKRIQS